MRRFALLVFFVMTFMLVLFIFAQVLNIPFLTEETYPQQDATVLAGVLNGTLLIIDILLPVPSSLVMITNGALFGVIGGAALSFISSLIAAFLGYYVGRSNQPWLGRFIGQDEYQRARAFMERWGKLALIVSRPIPILAETMCIIAGASNLSLRTTLQSITLGLIPIVFLYAYVGFTATGFESGLLAFTVVILTASLTWFIGLRVNHR